MLNEKATNTQIDRLMQLPFPPDSRDGVIILRREYWRLLKGHAKSDAHVEAICNHLMNTTMRVPPPAELYEAATTIDPPEVLESPNGCSTCQGTGLRSFQRWFDGAGGVGGYTADYSTFCECPKGEWLRAHDERRGARPKRRLSAKGA